MDNFKHDDAILSVLQEFRDLRLAHEENKKAQEEQAKLIVLLQEDLKMARDSEKAAESRKSRAQGFVSQQQEIILKLLGVKEENDNLKQTIHQMEKTIFDIQNTSMANHVKKDEEVHKIKQDYLKELFKIQAAADAKVNKIKADVVSSIDELKAVKSKNEGTIDEQSQIIESLQLEIKELKEKDSVNVDIFQKKLAEQERKHQAELETWKLSELNQTQIKTAQENNLTSQYISSRCLPNNPYQQRLNRQFNNYENTSHLNSQLNSYSNLQMQNQTPSWQSYSNQQPPLKSRCRNSLANGLSNVVRPLSHSSTDKYQHNDFLSVNDLYMQSKNLQDTEEDKEQNLKTQTENSTNVVYKPKIPVPNKRRKLFNPDENIV